jgi:predicted Zn-ribbon and HTH transcriptional regulator
MTLTVWEREHGPIRRHPGRFLICLECGYRFEGWTPFIMNVIKCPICNSKELQEAPVARARS